MLSRLAISISFAHAGFRGISFRAGSSCPIAICIPHHCDDRCRWHFAANRTRQGSARPKVGEPIAGRVMQPVYVFDRLVIPVGAVAVGRISVIEPVSARRRTLDALNAEFTPYHKLAVLFDGLIFPNGRHIDLHAAIVPGSGEIIRLVTADERKRTW